MGSGLLSLALCVSAAALPVAGSMLLTADASASVNLVPAVHAATLMPEQARQSLQTLLITLINM